MGRINLKNVKVNDILSVLKYEVYPLYMHSKIEHSYDMAILEVCSIQKINIKFKIFLFLVNHYHKI